MMCKWVTIEVKTWKGNRHERIQVPCNSNTSYEELVKYAYEIYNRR